MGKYIDAEKLNAEIKRRIEWLSTATNDFAEGRRAELRSLYDFVAHLQQEQLIKSELKEEKIECSPVIKEFIDKFFEVGRSYNFGFGPKDFQQEQPGLPGIEENGIPGKDFIPVEWVDACKKYGKWEIVRQEQPEVDLEKEYKTWWNSISGKINVEHMMEQYMHETARHFYELGKNARKKDTQ